MQHCKIDSMPKIRFTQGMKSQEEVENMRGKVRQGKESEARAHKQLQSKQANIRRLRSFLKADLKSSVRPICY